MENTYAWDKVEGAANYTRVTLTARDAGDQQWQRILRDKMWLALNDIKPHVVVIPGWIYAEALSALSWCSETNTPAAIMSESTEWDDRRTWWKEWLKGRIVKMCAAGLVGGVAHADYMAKLGLPGNKTFFGYDAIDNHYFAAGAEAARRQPSAVSRQPAEIPEKYFLASARFVEKKNLPRLLRAYARYRELAQKSETPKSETLKAESGKQKAEMWNLVLLGDGELRSSILELRASLGLDDCVQLPGFKQYEELPTYYGLASAFVHASTTEQWGLVVNEAMAAGLPVLVSNRCGCAKDLVREGVNGYTFDPLDVEQLAQLMFQLSTFPPVRLSAFGSASRELISDWGPERFASGLCDVVTMALNSPRRTAGLLDRVLLKALLQR
jgi:glycosyltransferase involved in cell wall biosynthesis